MFFDSSNFLVWKMIGSSALLGPKNTVEDSRVSLTSMLYKLFAVCKLKVKFVMMITENRSA